MPPVGVLAIAAVAAMLYIGGSHVVRGTKAAAHKVAHVFHKSKPAQPAPAKETK